MVSEVFDTRSIPVVPFVFVPEAGKDEKIAANVCCYL